MASDVTLHLKEEYLKTESIWLEADGYTAAEREQFEQLDRPDTADIAISVDRNTGDILLVVIEEFKAETETAIKNLRDNPLPWTFSLPQLKIKGKPLEDVLLAVWKKYRNMKMDWDD